MLVTLTNDSHAKIHIRRDYRATGTPLPFREPADFHFGQPLYQLE